MLRKETKTRTQPPEHIPIPSRFCVRNGPHLLKKENERYILYTTASEFIGRLSTRSGIRFVKRHFWINDGNVRSRA